MRYSTDSHFIVALSISPPEVFNLMARDEDRHDFSIILESEFESNDVIGLHRFLRPDPDTDYIEGPDGVKRAPRIIVESTFGVDDTCQSCVFSHCLVN